jgi:hypothetical protein
LHSAEYTILAISDFDVDDTFASADRAQIGYLEAFA